MKFLALNFLGRAVEWKRPTSPFFFFQAEDGIRDYKVTGVQTCALPILGIVHGRSGLPLCVSVGAGPERSSPSNRAAVSRRGARPAGVVAPAPAPARSPGPDRKSTRLNSSHLVISYAVFCLKKKKKRIHR